MPPAARTGRPNSQRSWSAAAAPIAFLVIANGDVRLLKMDTDASTADRMVEAIPGVINTLGDVFGKKKEKKEKEAKPPVPTPETAG